MAGGVALQPPSARRLRHPGSAFGRRVFPGPPTVYRALEFLLTQGLVHRLSSLNAFVGCARPGRPHAGQFLLCTDCGSAAELNDPDIERAIEHGAAAEGFVCRNHTVEISGLCPHCRGLTDRPLEADPPG